MKEKKFDLAIILALIFSIIGMFYCIYLDNLTDFLIFESFFLSIYFFSIIYSEIQEVKEKLKELSIKNERRLK